MRLTQQVQNQIREIVADIMGPDAETYVFGSRTDDNARGGDVDILVVTGQSVEHPAQTAARLESRIMRLMHGRKVDVLLKAPNLEHHPIHTIATETGVRL